MVATVISVSRGLPWMVSSCRTCTCMTDPDANDVPGDHLRPRMTAMLWPAHLTATDMAGVRQCYGWMASDTWLENDFDGDGRCDLTISFGPSRPAQHARRASPRLPDREPERAGQALEVGGGVGRGLVARGAAPAQVGEPVEQAPGRVLGEPQVDSAPHPGRRLGGARDRVERGAVERAVGGGDPLDQPAQAVAGGERDLRGVDADPGVDRLDDVLAQLGEAGVLVAQAAQHAAAQ